MFVAQVTTTEIVAIVLPTILGVGALVAPLYIMVLRGYGDNQQAEGERQELGEGQNELATEFREFRQEFREEMQDLRREVEENGLRSETNQRHIHQLLLGKIDDDDNDIGNPHYQADNCPLPDVCPWCSETNQDGA